METFVRQISCGAHHSALLTIDGRVYSMGSNIHGALGVSPSLNYSFSPTLVEGLEEVSSIECGPFHMCAVQRGHLYTWGKGIDGQLGHGNTKNVAKPSLVEGLVDEVERVSCGTNHTIVSVRKDVDIDVVREKVSVLLLEMASMANWELAKAETAINPSRSNLKTSNILQPDRTTRFS